MKIKSLKLKNFRNYELLNLEFDGSTNIFYGDNAQGKTNILEAVYLSGTTKSHRGSKDRDMIRFGAEESHIEVIVEKRGIQDQIDMHLKKNRPKGVAINKIPIRKAGELFGIVNLVFFSPEDLNIIKNGPAERRRFLDSELCQLDRIYLAATSAMSLFNAVDALDHIRLTGTRASGWYIDAAVEALNSGAMLFSGKYSEPDYEMLVDEDCDVAIESTMILHTPKVQEMIEDLGIPVFVDYSSYESHPLGRTEWIKLYGALLNKEEEADTFFDQQAHVIEELKGFENTEKTVAYFYVSTDGSIVVRKSDDYIPSMIEIAGGRYAFKDLKNPDSTAPSVKLTMEEFYATAVDADYLIYNGTIDGQINSISELEAKNELFSEFKAVKDGNVWYTGKNLYQATDTVGELIKDMHLMLTDGDASQMTFLEKME